MKTRIIKIDNSRGVRIPKLLLEQSNLTEEVKVEAEDGCIIVRSAPCPRQGWGAAFRRMSELGDDRLLDGEFIF